MRYVFGDYEVDTQRNELRHGEFPPLESQVFQVLVYLVQHRDRVVSKAELLEYLWPQQYISETTLSQRLMLVRKAVGDSGRRQRVITTVPGRGYRFVATVEEQTEIPQPQHAAVFGGYVPAVPGGGRSDIMETLMRAPPCSAPVSARQPGGGEILQCLCDPVAVTLSLLWHGKSPWGEILSPVCHPSLVLHQTRTGPMCPSPTLPRT